MAAPDPYAIASSWIANFGHALEAGDVIGAVSTFALDGYLRDILVFTWNNRTLHRRDAITSFLMPTLPNVNITNVQVDERQYFSPTYGPIGPGVFAVSTGFTFETPIAKVQGYARLVEDKQKQWKALSVFTMIDELKGHPEMGQESGSYGGHTRTYRIVLFGGFRLIVLTVEVAWSLVKEERQLKVESDPHVIIGSVTSIS